MWLRPVGDPALVDGGIAGRVRAALLVPYYGHSAWRFGMRGAFSALLRHPSALEAPLPPGS